MICIFDPACELLPPMDGEELYLCTVECCPSTVPSLWPPPPSPSFPLYSIYRQCVTLGGGGVVEMYCGPYSAGFLHSVSDQVQNLQNCFTTPNKMTSEDDITGLVSLKFLRPWAIRILCDNLTRAEICLCTSKWFSKEIKLYLVYQIPARFI